MMTPLFRFIIVAVEILLTVLFLHATPGPYNFSIHLLCGLVVILDIILFLKISSTAKLKKYWAKPSNLFILSFLIVNFQTLLDVFLGIKSSDSCAYPYTLNLCSYLATIGICSFIIGYSISTTNWHNRHELLPNSVSNKRTSLLFVTIQIVCFFLFIINIDIQSFITGAVYADSNEFSKSNYFEILLIAINSAIIVDQTYGMSNKTSFKIFLKSFNPISIFIVVIYLILRLLSGDRGPAIMMVLMLFYAYIYLSKKRIKPIYLVIVVFFAATILSILGISRQNDLVGVSLGEKMKISSSIFQEEGRFGSTGEKSLFASTEELANSFIVNQIAIDARKQNNKKIHHGSYQLVSLINPIPFIPGYLKRHFPAESISSTSFVDEYYLGANRNWSLGTTILADFYLDLGIIGVIVLMVLVGFFFRKIDSHILLNEYALNNRYVFTIIIYYASYAVNLPRTNFLSGLKGCVFVVVFLFFNELISKKQSIRN